MADTTKSKSVFVFNPQAGQGFVPIPDGKGKGNFLKASGIQPSADPSEIVEVDAGVWDSVKNTKYGARLMSFDSLAAAEKALKTAKIKAFPKARLFQDQDAIIKQLTR